MSAAENKAVFLSYASQDAEAARKICDALRASGVEVWFDADGGLEHGDEWDAKIRWQIKECVLFIPIISAKTQARLEGYFRIEWALASERAVAIADGVPFILPVLIDETREPDALVPDRFRKVQWLRLPGGAVTPQVQERLLKLWSHRTGALRAGEWGQQTMERTRADDPLSPVSRPRSGVGRWLGAAIAASIAILAVAGWIFSGRSSAPTSNSGLKTTNAKLPVATQTPATEARQLVARAWDQLNRPELSRAGLEIADDLCRRATTLNPDDAEAWAAWSQADSWYVYSNLDHSAQRREVAQSKATRALELDPNSFEARLAQACCQVRGVAESGEGKSSSFAAGAEKSLRELLREKLKEPRACFALGILLRNAGRFEESLAEFDRMAESPAFAAVAHNEKGWLRIMSRDYALAAVEAERSIALHPYSGNLLLRLRLASEWTGDLDAGKATVESMPATTLQEDGGACEAARLFLLRREPQEVLRLLDAVPRSWLTWWNTPKSSFVGMAHAMRGAPEAARVAWTDALQVTEARLASEPQSPLLLGGKAWLLALLERREEAAATMRLARSLQKTSPLVSAIFASLMGDPSDAMSELENAYAEVTWATLRLDPRLDALRSNPRFQALLARAEADPRKCPHAKTAAVTTPAIRMEKSVNAPDKSIAVLAFDNRSDDKEAEYFSDGISEELINVLCRVPGLTVKGQTSAFYFKDKKASSAEIAQQLGVAYLVRGGVRRMGNNVRITAQLTRAASDEVLWSSAPLTRELKDVFAVQEEIAGMIAQELSLKLGVKTKSAAPVNPQAFELYLQARREWSLRTEAALARAEELLSRTLELDPSFARAHAALADVWNARAGMHTHLIGTFGQRDSPEFARIIAKISHALALDPDSADAHAAMGAVLWQSWKFGEADRSLRRAIAISPNFATAHQWLGRILEVEGRIDEALAELRRAAELDPLSPIILTNLAGRLNYAGRFREALQVADRAFALQSEFSVGEKANALIGLGRIAEAAALIRTDGTSRRGPLQARVLALAAQREEATRLLAEAVDLRGRAVSAIVWLALGEREKAIASLQADTMDVVRIGLLYDDSLQPIHDTPEFKRFIAELGLTETFARAQAWRGANSPEKVGK